VLTIVLPTVLAQFWISTGHERLPGDRWDSVRAIARVLMAEFGKSMVEVWEEALSIYRVQFNDLSGALSLVSHHSVRLDPYAGSTTSGNIPEVRKKIAQPDMQATRVPAESE
jgi:hypothetical protein